MQFNFSHNVSQLFVDFVSTLKGRLKQTSYLLSNKNLEGYLRDEKTWWKSLSILNGSLYVFFWEILEGIYILDWFYENIVENVVNTRATKALSGTLFDKFTFYHFSIRISEAINKIQDDWSLVSFDRVAVHIKLDEL